ncbi:hypothetical protein RJ55_06740 [Drechmeria coniospora]|nr:hypothetical protein RJ55_06740 [Drechmeria coniospora]
MLTLQNPYVPLRKRRPYLTDSTQPQNGIQYKKLLHDQLRRVQAKEQAASRAVGQLQLIASKIEQMIDSTSDLEFSSWKTLIELGEFEDRIETDGGENNVMRGERAKFNDQIDLIRDWSGLSEQQLRDFGYNSLASEITNNCQMDDLVFNLSHPQKGVVIGVSSDSELEFRLAFKQYVGRARGNSDLLRWPLVEMVEVFVEADTLRDGIVLVDLPEKPLKILFGKTKSSIWKLTECLMLKEELERGESKRSKITT